MRSPLPRVSPAAAAFLLLGAGGAAAFDRDYRPDDLSTFDAPSPESPYAEAAAEEEDGPALRARCSRSIHDDAIEAAVAGANALEPRPYGERSAGDALIALQDGDEVAPHLGRSLFYAVRSQGYELVEGLYCHEAPVEKGAAPVKWIGVRAADGTAFFLELGEFVAGFGPARVQAERAGDREPSAGPFGSETLEGIFACGRGQAHVAGALGGVFDELLGDRFSAWSPTPRCKAAAFSDEAPAAEARAGAYDPDLGGRVAEASAAMLAVKRYPKSSCWAAVADALDRAGLTRTPGSYAAYGDLAYYEDLIPADYAYRVHVWADRFPESARRILSMEKIVPTPRRAAEVPRGSLVVYDPGGPCGFSPTAGHIEIAYGDGVFCHYACASGRDYCFSDPAKVHVYKPVVRAEEAR